jgi:hypothetical protein
MQLLCVNGTKEWSSSVFEGDLIYYCLSDFTEKDLPKSAGFRWHPIKKVWWTDRQETAAKLSDFISDPLSTWAKDLYAIKMRVAGTITECPYCDRDGLPVIDHKNHGGY